MLDGSLSNQQVLRELLLASVPDLRAHGAARKVQYIRRLPDVERVEVTIGIKQSSLDARLVLKDRAMILADQAEPLMKALAGQLGGRYFARPIATRRATLVIEAPDLDSNEASVEWVRKALDGLLHVRKQVT